MYILFIYSTDFLQCIYGIIDGDIEKIFSKVEGVEDELNGMVYSKFKS